MSFLQIPALINYGTEENMTFLEQLNIKIKNSAECVSKWSMQILVRQKLTPLVPELITNIYCVNKLKKKTFKPAPTDREVFMEQDKTLPE